MAIPLNQADFAPQAIKVAAESSDQLFKFLTGQRFKGSITTHLEDLTPLGLSPPEFPVGPGHPLRSSTDR